MAAKRAATTKVTFILMELKAEEVLGENVKFFGSEEALVSVD